jgi:hypothetical protein
MTPAHCRFADQRRHLGVCRAFPERRTKGGSAAATLRPDWSFEVVPVKDGVLPASPEAFDGYVITGSPASVNDDSLSLGGAVAGFHPSHAMPLASR